MSSLSQVSQVAGDPAVHPSPPAPETEKRSWTAYLLLLPGALAAMRGNRRLERRLGQNLQSRGHFRIGAGEKLRRERNALRDERAAFVLGHDAGRSVQAWQAKKRRKPC